MAGEVAPNDHLHFKRTANPSDRHIRIRDIDHPIRNNIRRGLQHLRRDLIEHRSLLRNGTRKHHIERGYPIRNDHDQVFTIDRIDIPHLAPVKSGLAGEIKVRRVDCRCLHSVHHGSAVLVIRFDDLLHQTVANDILRVEIDEIDSPHIGQYLDGLHQSGRLVFGQIDLRHITRDDELG